MTERGILEILLAEFHEKLKVLGQQLITRDLEFAKATNKIKVALGMRRSGKSFFMYQTIQQLLAQGIPLTRILYINFEDDRLLPLDREKLAKLIDAFYHLYPENHDSTCYLFLDEIQEVDDWAIVVRRLHDSKNAQLFLSGSSAKLLSKEIATALRGRSLSTEVWPYSFKEYLRATGVVVEDELFSLKKHDQLSQQLIQYLNSGGFPEVPHYEPIERIQTLQEYIDVVIYRDIIERYGVKHPSLIKYLITFMLQNISRPFTINKFYQDIKGQGYQVAKDSLYDYVAHIEDAYLAFTVSFFDRSLRKVQANPKKIYAVDSGLVNAVSIGNNSNQGKLFENLIYLDLRRQGCQVNYYLTHEHRYEIDFVVQPLAGQPYLLQVCWDISDPDTRAREERALKQAEQELGMSGYIITLQEYLKTGLNLIG